MRSCSDTAGLGWRLQLTDAICPAHGSVVLLPGSTNGSMARAL